MKKLFNISLAIALTLCSVNISDAKKSSKNAETSAQEQNVKSNTKDTSVQIIKPGKNKKINKRQEEKKQKLKTTTQKSTSKEAEGIG